MRKSLIIFLFPALFAVPSFANEQAELDQALRQLESAKQALYRAQQQARQSSKVQVKARFYFDYLKARQDIELVKEGIHHYLNTDRAQPRDPRQLKTLSGDYNKIRASQ